MKKTKCQHKNTEIHEYLESDDGFETGIFCNDCEEYIQPQPEHTPGPWTVEKTKGGYERVQKNGDIICWTGISSNSGNNFWNPLKNHKANARLIAAAPELFEALKRMLDVYGPHIFGEKNLTLNQIGTFELSLDAIARAEGRA